MATALHGYGALKEICDHSFEGVTYGQKSMNYFVAENARIIRAAAPNVNLSLFKGNSVSNAYVVSKGSLQPIKVTAAETDFDIKLTGLANGNTFGMLMSKLGATNIGDMVTFVALVDNPGGNASIYWLRIKLTEANSVIKITTLEGWSIYANLAEGVDYETNIDNFDGETDFPILIGDKGGTPTLSVSLGTNGQNASMGVILSRKSDTGWLRSSSTMVNLKNTFNYSEALASYPENGEKILNGGNV